MIWACLICAVILVTSNYGFYLSGRKSGRLEHESKTVQNAQNTLVQARAIRHRLRYDHDFAKRVRETYRR